MTDPKYVYLATYSGIGDILEIEGVHLRKGEQVEVLKVVADAIGDRRDVDIERIPVAEAPEDTVPATPAEPEPQAADPQGLADDGAGERDPNLDPPQEG